MCKDVEEGDLRYKIKAGVNIYFKPENMIFVFIAIVKLVIYLYYSNRFPKNVYITTGYHHLNPLHRYIIIITTLVYRNGYFYIYSYFYTFHHVLIFIHLYSE